MKRIELYRLPTHFRYLLTIKEVKKIETELDFKFVNISSGRSNSGHEKFDKEAYVKSSIRIVTISGYKREGAWHFYLVLSSFRRELLPNEFGETARKLTIDKIKEYISRIRTSRETDLIHSLSIWGYLMISDSGLTINWIEGK
jgi:hypothetical protein